MLYKQALYLARQTGKSDVQMEILKELWNIGKTIGDVQQAQAYAASIDSLESMQRLTCKLSTLIIIRKAMRQETWAIQHCGAMVLAWERYCRA